MKYRGGYRFSLEALRDRLEIADSIYKVDLENGSVVFWCHGVQDEIIVRAGEIAPVVRNVIK